jgi:hypothetical protein
MGRKGQGLRQRVAESQRRQKSAAKRLRRLWTKKFLPLMADYLWLISSSASFIGLLEMCMIPRKGEFSSSII